MIILFLKMIVDYFNEDLGKSADIATAFAEVISRMK